MPSNCSQPLRCSSWNHSGKTDVSDGPERISPDFATSCVAVDAISSVDSANKVAQASRLRLCRSQARGLRHSLSDRAFHLELDQTLQLDAVFHGELADQVVNESVHAQAHGLRLTQPALLHVEN